jgi:AAA domain
MSDDILSGQRSHNFDEKSASHKYGFDDIEEREAGGRVYVKQQEKANRYFSFMEKPTALFIQGPPGSAKSGLQRKLVLRQVLQKKVAPAEVLFLCFSRKKSNEISQSIRKLAQSNPTYQELKKVRVGNIHSLTHKILGQEIEYRFGSKNREQHELQAMMGNLESGKDSSETLNVTLEFDGMIEELTHLLAGERINFRNRIRLLVIDETQILSVSLLGLILHLCKQMGYPDLIVAGDQNQDLYSWVKNKQAKEGSIQALREVVKDTYDLRETRSLNYRRGTLAIATFLQGMEDKAGRGIQISLLKLAHKSTLYSAGEAPKIVLLENKEKQRRFLQMKLREMRRRYPDDSVLVLARNNWVSNEISLIRGERFETIHSCLGTEADHVIWADFGEYDAPEIFEPLARVGGSRAKKTLTVVGTCPELHVSRWFKPTTFEMENRQRKTAVTPIRKNLKHISKDVKKSLQKLTLIDSLTLCVDHADAPFSPCIEHNFGDRSDRRTLQKSAYTTLRLKAGTKIEHVPDYSISMQMQKGGKRYYRFEFMSLNFLRLNGYSDKDIILTLSNEVAALFEGRIAMEKIRIGRIDLAGYFVCDEAQKRMLLEGVCAVSGSGLRFRKREIEPYDVDGDPEDTLSPDTAAAYANLGEKGDGIRILGYDPARKPPMSEKSGVETPDNYFAVRAYKRPDLFKIEHRILGKKKISTHVRISSVKELLGKVSELSAVYKALSVGLGLMEGNRACGIPILKQSKGVFWLK